MSRKHKITPLRVIARSPTTVFFEGEAESLAAENRVGEFSILSGHADFFSLLEPCTVQIISADTTTEFGITGGVLTVQNGEAMLFCNM